jgi:hypothetical protein
METDSARVDGASDIHAGERNPFLRVYMNQLRQKLEFDSARPKCLLTATGVATDCLIWAAPAADADAKAQALMPMTSCAVLKSKLSTVEPAH